MQNSAVFLFLDLGAQRRVFFFNARVSMERILKLNFSKFAWKKTKKQTRLGCNTVKENVERILAATLHSCLFHLGLCSSTETNCDSETLSKNKKSNIDRKLQSTWCPFSVASSARVKLWLALSTGI